MKAKKFLVPCLALVLMGTTLVSCGDDNNHNSNELYVCVYDGGYGTEWIETLAAKYEEKTGVKVHAESDLSILERMDDQLKNGADYDIYMSHDINWQQYAANGWLENLDDLYETKIEGTDETFEQRLVSGAAKISRYTNASTDEEHYYKSCYTQGAGGLVYNIEMFEANNWQVPTTYDELVALCQTIVDAEIEVPGTRNTVVPFAWSGSERQYYWDYLVFEWWAQLAGLDKIETIKQYKGSNGFTDGYEMYNPDSYYKEFIQAYEMWYNLVAMHKEYSMDNAQGETLVNAQAAFANGRAAMIPYAQWAQYEIENSTDKKLPNIAMMKTPKANNNVIDVNYLVGFGDSMIIPSSISDESKQNAKDFMAYLASPEACKIFVEKAKGAFLAFDYDDVDLSEIEATNKYTKSVHEKLTQCQNFTMTTNVEIAIWTTNSVMPWIANKYYYANAVANPQENTPEIVGQEIYNTAKTSWPVWLRSAGL